MHHLKTALLTLAVTFAQLVLGQSNEQKALDKGHQALQQEDQGDMDGAISLLKEAQKLDPGNMNYPYEIAYAYYGKQDYKQASKYLEGLLKHKDVNDMVYQLLGNSYDELGDHDKAVETYEKGLKRFPNSGNLYLELGVVQLGLKDHAKALSYFEKGIEVAPAYPSNYYWAAKLFCNSTEEVWGMIYGEIFMNLERNTKRTAEISKLLYDTYKSEIKFTSDTSFSVSFSKNATMSLDDLKDPDKFKLPFGIGVYEPVLMLTLINEHEIDINSLDRVRTAFIEGYYKGGHDSTYPNVLFDYERKVHDAGQSEAYNHWILMKGDEDGFGQWQAANKDKWGAFTAWFAANPIHIDDAHRFYRAQY